MLLVWGAIGFVGSGTSVLYTYALHPALRFALVLSSSGPGISISHQGVWDYKERSIPLDYSYVCIRHCRLLN